MPSSLLASVGRFVDRATINTLDPPPSTKSHHPVAFGVLLDLVTESLKTRGWDITKEEHVISHEGMRYFGTFGLTKKGKNLGRGVVMAAGILSSYDRTVANMLLGGWEVSTCSNRQYTRDLLAMGRNTRHVMDRLPGKILNAAQSFDDYVDRQRAHIEWMRETPISVPEAYHHMILLARKGVMCWTDVGRVSHIFDTDERWGVKHTLWRLANSVTAILQPKLLEKNGASYSEKTCKLNDHILSIARAA